MTDHQPVDVELEVAVVLAVARCGLWPSETISPCGVDLPVRVALGVPLRLLLRVLLGRELRLLDRVVVRLPAPPAAEILAIEQRW